MGVPPEKGDDFDTVEEFGALFADLGMRPKHWLKARQIWMWMLPSIPYLEEYDLENLEQVTNSALYKFFNTHVILPMAAAIQRYENALPPEMLQRMANSWSVFSQNKQEMGMEFYQIIASAQEITSARHSLSFCSNPGSGFPFLGLVGNGIQRRSHPSPAFSICRWSTEATAKRTFQRRL